ncbi:hypothetical protein Defa_19010 [Desulfovibrio sp. TH_2024_36128]|uniref:Uncharacterized protein n=1 Tax=Desulfovibrio falkowii TaxID=3136602 RepID=A0ABQ0E9S2_9BACT
MVTAPESCESPAFCVALPDPGEAGPMEAACVPVAEDVAEAGVGAAPFAVALAAVPSGVFPEICVVSGCSMVFPLL